MNVFNSKIFKNLENLISNRTQWGRGEPGKVDNKIQIFEKLLN